MLSVSPEKAPDKPTFLEITFEKGDPVALDGESMSPAGLLSRLNAAGGENGIGRVDLVENRYVGMKSRGVYETPGGTILRTAHLAMESITMDREVMHIRDGLIPRYAEMVYYGYWFSPERVMLQNLMDEAQRNVNGVVRVKLYKGNCTVVGRKSDRSLYHPGFASFEKEEVYNQKDAEGFIRLNALRLKIASLLSRGKMTGIAARDHRRPTRSGEAVSGRSCMRRWTASTPPFRLIAGSTQRTSKGAWPTAGCSRNRGSSREEEAAQILRALEEIEEGDGPGGLASEEGFEDIHTLVEKTLVERVGPPGEKLHTGRSRNDQVALDVRLYVKKAIRRVDSLIRGLQRALVGLAEEHLGLIMPGYTHLQRAQPVLLAHHLLAYYEMLKRDRARFRENLKRVNVLPLGSAALAGSTFPLDRDDGGQGTGVRRPSRRTAWMR